MDEHFYLISDNPNLLKVLDTLECNYHGSDVQSFIDRIISWYTIKYSDAFLNSLFDKKKETNLDIVEIMNFNSFRKRYGAFEKDLFCQKKNTNKIILQKYLIVMAGWGLIYSKQSTPEYGYYRVKQLFNDFNSFYSWNLTPTFYHEVLQRDYSLSNENNVKFLEDMKKKKHNNHHKQKKKLFYKRIFFN